MMGIKHFLTEDVYDVILFEFDTDTAINLI